MNDFSRLIQIRWSDLDPNFHLRHSVYYDWGAFCRVEFLNAYGLNYQVMQDLQFGPILFREECVFRKEIRMQDKVKIDLRASKAKKDFSRWSCQHRIFKNETELSALLTVDIAWIDTIKRKLTGLPAEVLPAFHDLPVTEDFQWLD